VIRTAPAILPALAVGLVATLAWELGAFASPDTRIAPHPRAAAATAAQDAAPDHTSEWIAAVLARLVFSPDRRPPAEIASTPGVPVADGLPRRGSSSLVGVL
jgi:hypothetical protein